MSDHRRPLFRRNSPDSPRFARLAAGECGRLAQLGAVLTSVLCFILLAVLLPRPAWAGAASPSMREATQCMLKILKSTPGVREPRVGETTTNGATRPYIEYRAAEGARWEEPTRFTLQQSGGSQFWFVALLPGLVTPGSGLDTHITDIVVKKWKARCDVDAVVVTV